MMHLSRSRADLVSARIQPCSASSAFHGFPRRGGLLFDNRASRVIIGLAIEGRCAALRSGLSFVSIQRSLSQVIHSLPPLSALPEATIAGMLIVFATHTSIAVLWQIVSALGCAELR